MEFYTLLVNDSRSFWQRAFKPFAFFSGMRFVRKEFRLCLDDDILPPVYGDMRLDEILTSDSRVLRGFLLGDTVKEDSGEIDVSKDNRRGVVVHIAIRASPMYPSKTIHFSDAKQRFLREQKSSEDVKSLIVHMQPDQCFQLRIGTYLYGDFECRGDTLVEITPWTYKLLNFLGL